MRSTARSLVWLPEEPKRTSNRSALTYVGTVVDHYEARLDPKTQDYKNYGPSQRGTLKDYKTEIGPKLIAFFSSGKKGAEPGDMILPVKGTTVEEETKVAGYVDGVPRLFADSGQPHDPAAYRLAHCPAQDYYLRHAIKDGA